MGLGGRLAALSAVLTRGLDGRGPAPSLRGTAGIWRRLCSRQEPRKGSLQVFLGGAFLVHLRVPPPPTPGGVGKSSASGGVGSGDSAPIAPGILPQPSAPLRPRCPPHLHLHSRSRQGTGLPYRARLPPPARSAPELPRARLDLQPGSLLSRTRETSG